MLRHRGVADTQQEHEHEFDFDGLQQALMTSRFMADAMDGDAMSDVYALEVFRDEVRRAEQLRLDEAIALSLYDAEVTALLQSGDDNDSDNGGIVVVSIADLESKRPPSCACCLLELADSATRRMLPCGHLYCLACISTRVGMGVRDRTLLPAHCCRQEFPIEYVAETLSNADFQRYEAYLKDKDWTTLDLDSDRAYTRVAQQHNCVQCPGCGIAVSRTSGCNRMRCCNGHEFCYACGKRWKSCGCNYS